MNAGADNLRPFGITCAPSAEQRTYEGAAALRIFEGDEGAQVAASPGEASHPEIGAKRKTSCFPHFSPI